MRRCLHAFLVGVLTVSMPVDAARACWHLRRGCHPSRPTVVVCPPASAIACECWVEGKVVGEGEPVSTDEWAVWDAAIESQPMGVVVESHVGIAAETVTPSQPAPVEPTTTAVAEEVPELRPAEPAPLEDVQQTAAVAESVMQPEAPAPLEVAQEPVAPAEPTPEPAMIEEAAAAPPASPELPAAEPVEENIFEEVDRADGSTTGIEAAAASAPPVLELAAAAVVDEPSAVGTLPAPVDATVAAVERDIPTAGSVSREPLEPTRRWIDQSGRYAVVGTLVAVRQDGTCVIESAGRTLEVPLELLSEFDRDYASAAAERLADASTPEAGDTVGL